MKIASANDNENLYSYYLDILQCYKTRAKDELIRQLQEI